MDSIDMLLSLHALFLFVPSCETIHRIQNNNSRSSKKNKKNVHRRNYSFPRKIAC